VKPTIVNTSDLAAVSPYMCDVVLAEGLKAVCLIPLVKRGRALGMLRIGRTGKSAFTPNDVEFLTRVSGQTCEASIPDVLQRNPSRSSAH
jgi:GAF domain-containing protein